MEDFVPIYHLFKLDDGEIWKIEKNPGQNLWGFTIVRRVDPEKGIRSSSYKYLAPKGQIMTFDADELPLLPGSYPNANQNLLQWGTFIKLYEYQMIGLKKIQMIIF